MNWLKNLCRFCGKIGDICYNIFDPNLEILEKIKKCLNTVQILEEDFKPKEICSPCYLKIDDINRFIDMYVSTSIKFESIYFANPYSIMHNGKNNFEGSTGQIHDYKQSVIVNNKQEIIDPNIEYRRNPKDDEMIEILEDSSITQPEILKYNNYIHPIELNTFCANDRVLSNPHKETEANNGEPIKNIDVQNGKTAGDCLVLGERISSEIFILANEVDERIINNSIDYEPNSEYNTSQGREFNSVNDVNKKPLQSEQISHFKLDKSYSCPHCEKTFKRRINLSAHISVHTNIRDFKCSKCPKTFSVKCHLTQHIKIHSELFKCHVCQKRFQVPSKLLRHIQTHNAHKPFICTFSSCKKAFSDKNNLKQHISSHTALKNMSCNICEKLFKTRKNLNAHIKSHVSGKLYQCAHCEKTFRYRHNLKTHSVKHSS